EPVLREIAGSSPGSVAALTAAGRRTASCQGERQPQHLDETRSLSRPSAGCGSPERVPPWPHLQCPSTDRPQAPPALSQSGRRRRPSLIRPPRRSSELLAMAKRMLIDATHPEET